jgi:hypothetical protein
VPLVNLLPTSLSFGNQNVGTSAVQTVTLTNGGTAALSISSIASSGDFAQTNNCGSTLAAGANCAIQVTFTPTATGARSGTLSVSDNAAGSPQTVSLSGTGTTSAASLSPTSLSFGVQSVGTTSPAQTVTLSSTGTGPLAISSIAVSGDFAETNNCGTGVAAGANCTITVTFTPTATGARSGTLSVSDNAPGSPHTVSLTGTGDPTGPGIANPKFLVLSVIYAPPGQSSSVDYGSSTATGSNTSFDSSYKDQKSMTTSLQLGPGIKSTTLTATKTGSFTQTQDVSGSITLNKTTGFDVVAPGPANSTDGINHDYDLILLWLNPVVNLNVASSGTTATWTGYTFDANDPANEVDIVPVYVAWLKNPSTMPPGVANSLARTWAQPPADGQGPGLNGNDFIQILARDPFANGATAIDPTRFDLTGQTLSFAPPVNGGAPLTQGITLQYQNTSKQGTKATDQYKTSYSVEITSSIAGFFKATLTDTTTLTWTNTVAQSSTQTSGQTAKLALTGPSSSYNGPTDVQVYQDNVYGTFMFAFVPEKPALDIWASPATQTAPLNGTAPYTVGLSAVNDFPGPVTLSASVSPSGCSTVSFSPASISGSATSNMTLSCSSAGTYSITVTGVSGNVNHSTTVNLTVIPTSFTLAEFPPSQAVLPGGSASYTVLSNPATGFNGSVTLSAPSPAGCGAITFAPPSISGPGTSTMTVPDCTTPGGYTITTTGTSGSLPTTTASVGLSVAQPVTPTGSGCTMGITASPSAPTTGQNVTITGSVQNAATNLGYSGSINVDGTSSVCTFNSPANGTQGCSGPVPPPPLTPGSHAINWTCSFSGGSGGGTQILPVGDASGTATVRPKFIVLSVLYAPPGQSSNVDYGTSTLVGTSANFVNTVEQSTSTTISVGGGVTIGPLSLGATVTDSQTFTQTGETNNTLGVSKTSGSDIAIPGPQKPGDGIDHNFDVILVWINPVVNFSITGVNSATITGYSFDPADPANEVDVVPLYVGWLQNPSTIPPGVAAVLARSWALPPTDGSGPGLTTKDFAQILGRDPFTNPSYTPVLNPGATTTTDGRFDLVGGETLSYAPPPSGDQPLTQKFNLQYQDTSETGLQTQDSYKDSYSLQVTVQGSVDVASWFKVNFKDQVNETNSMTWTSQATQTNTQTNGRTASLTLTGPSSAYNGPTDLQLFQDNVYGTYMFLFNPNSQNSDFGLLASPDAITTITGSSANFQISDLPLNGFNGSVALSATVSPSSGCGPVTLSPASIAGTATSSGSVTCSTPGNYTVTITGTNGSLTHTATVQLTIFQAPTYLLFASPSQGAVIPGNPSGAAFTVYTSAVAGFNGTVSLAASGPPNSGVSTSFNPPTITGTGTSTLTVSSSNPGTYPITITATSGTLSQTTSVTLVVAQAPSGSGNACAATITVVPAAASFNTPVTISVKPSIPPGDALVVNGFLDGNQFCSASNATSPCSQTFPNLASGTHAATWTCSDPNNSSVGPGSNTQIFAVGPTGSLNPKYLVLSVMYAPPGQSSTVDYGSSTMLGTATSLTDSFSSKNVLTSTLTQGLAYAIRQHKKGQDGNPFSVAVESTDTQTFTESLQSTSTITVNKTQSSDQVVPGALNTTTQGIDHDFDVILLWLNPVIELTITSNNTAVVAGYSFDENDPVGEMDVVPVYVGWLKNPSSMPPGVSFALARLWADQPLDGSGTGLTATDYVQILGRDPFANGATTIDPVRFSLTGETFAYAPAPNGGQPFTEISSLAYLTTAENSTTITDKYETSFSEKVSDSISMQGFLEANLALTGGIGSSVAKTLTITNSNGLQTTQASGQTATLSLVGPTSSYTGLTDLQVYQDAVYGTFLFAFVPETNFQVFVASPSQTTTVGGSATYAVSTTVISNFSGTISLSTSGLPSTGISAVFSPPTLNSAGSSTLTLSTSTSLTPGLYPFNIVGTVTGSGGTETHVVSASLAVTASGDFTLSISPSALEVIAGGAANYTVTTTAIGGFNGSVSLSASGLPTGATYTFNPASITGAGTSTLTISPAASAPPGNYAVTVTGTSGILTHTASADAAVAAPPTGSSTGTPCGVNVAMNPTTPIAGQSTVFQATITQVPPANSWSLSTTIDGQTLCGPTTSSCSQTENNLTAGPHTVGWTCSDSGQAGPGSGSGTFPFTVAPASLPSGSVNPKFLVLSVIYTPPGSQSFVDYGTSTAIGTSSSIMQSFGVQNTKVNVTLTGTISPPPSNPNENLGTVTGTGEGNATSTITETMATATSIALKKTSSYDIRVPGLFNPTDGIDHDYDIILVWLNPVINLQIVDNATAQIPGYGFDPADPAGEVDVVALYVKWLKNPSTMPPAIANALARAWAAAPADGSNNPALTSDDFQHILQRDPFTDPSYVLTVNPGNTTSTDGRFDLEAGETFAYEPPPLGGQPATEKFSLQYQQTSISGQSKTDEYQSTFSIAGAGNILSWLKGNLQNQTMVTLSSQFALQNTDTTTQTASLSLVGPCFGYTGPSDVQVYQDNVYGTFMFAFVANTQTPDFSLCGAPPSLPVNSGATGTFTIFTSPSNGFTNTVGLSVSVTGTPTGVTATLNPTSITGAGSSTLTVTVDPSVTTSGTYPVVVTGTSGSLTHTTTVLLVVNAVPDFSLAATPSSQSVNTGVSASTTVTTTAFNGFTGSIGLSASVSPSTGCNAPVFNPASITGSGTSTMTMTCPAAGSYTVTITGTSVNGPNTLTQSAQVTLTVTAVPIASLSATSLSFSNQSVGTTSGAQTVTLSNTGTAALTITSIAASGDFAQTNNCGSSLAVGANCAIQVTFTPTAAGSRNGTLSITDNAAGSPQSVSLTGTGIMPVANLSPTSLTFGNQNVGTTSTAQTVTLTNTGTDVLTISGIAASGDFAQTNNCGATLAVNGSCSISVTFTPSASSTRNGAVQVRDNAAGSPQSTSLTGTGVAPIAGLAPGSLVFSAQNVGTTSAAQAVTLSNSGNATLSISSITLSGDFAQTNNCGSSLAASGSCTISVTFTPSATGTRSGTLSVTDNAAGSPQTVSLSGTGGAAVAGLAPGSLTFAGQNLGTTSAAQTLTLSNSGSSPLSIAGIAGSGDFAETNNCGATLAAGASCSISVTFTPSATGTRNGTVSVTDNAAGSPQTASLSGTGTVPAAGLSPGSLTFAGQNMNTTSAAQTVTLTNSGTGPLNISGISASGDFAQTNNCGSTLAAGGSCSINVTFTPSASGPRGGTLSVTDNAAGSPQTVSLSGTGIVHITVTIGGSDSTDTTVICVPGPLGRPVCHTINFKDAGTIQFTVNAGGTTVGPVSTPYNGSSSPSTLASGLLSNFPANSLVTMTTPITNADGSSTFTLNSIAAGTSTFSTTLSSSCQNTDTTFCAGVGWTVTPSQGNFGP